MYNKTLTLLLVFLMSFAGQAQNLVNDKIDVMPGSGVDNRNAVLYFPKNYSEDKKYPLVIFTHGMGEAGTDINKLYRTGLPRVLKKGYRPSFDFIMVAPQSRSFSALANWLPGILEDAVKRWNIDTNRIYLTGLSAGGKSIYGSQLSLNPRIASKFAAIVTNAGVVPAASVTNYAFWKVSKTPLWAVVGSNDRSYVSKNARLVDNVNKQVPGIATLTLQKGVGHSGWDNVYNGKVKHGNKTMWEWMYQFNRASKNFPFADGNDNNDDNDDDNDDDGDDNDDNNDDDGDDDDDPPPPPTGPKTIQVNLFGGYNPYNNARWNNWNIGTRSKTNISSEAFDYTDATASTVKATLSESYALVDNSASYGGGMAPAQVLRHSSYAMKERTLVISGLNPDKKYDFEFYASRTRKNNKTLFTMQGKGKTINTYYNFTNKAEFKQVVPNNSGKVIITLKNLNQYNYLNGFKIIEDAEENNEDDNDGEEDDDDGEGDDDGDDQ